MNRKFYRHLWAIVLVLLSAELSFAQDRVVEGTVQSSSGETLPGVSVLAQGTNNGTVTDANGAYRISISGASSVLTFSYIGYASQEITVGDRTRIDVTMEPSLETLDEVVVIGYGTVKKSDLTGSVSSVKADEIKAVPTTSFDQALQGRAAGVQVVQTSGAPGAGASIRIRGVSSIKAGNEPLYVIDGMLINSNTSDVTAGGLVGSAPSINPLASINPNDIESIEILKDASATAIYGSRGTNGVILITTRHGKKGGAATIDFDSYIAFQQPTKTIKMLNASQFAELVNEARTNAGQLPEYVNPLNLGVGTDWQKELFRTSPMQSYQLSMSGGNDKTQYVVSGGYFDQDGIVVNTDFKRYSFRTNLNTQLTKRFSIGTNLMYAYTNGNSTNTGIQQITPGVIGAALGMNPILPVYNPNQEGGYTYENDRGTVIGNPVAEAMSHQAYSTNSRILGNVEGRLKLTDWLDIRSTFGIDANQSKDRTFAPKWLKAAQGSKGEAGIATLEAMTWLNENTINLNKTFNNGHNLTAVLGYTAQQFHNERLVSYVFGIDDARLGYHNMSTAKNPQPPANGETMWTMQSYLGRAQYSINSKYLFTVTGRVDGSSKFSRNNKYAFFPSAAAAWALHEEQFLKSVNFRSELKLRTSIGTIGNQAIGPYESLALVAPYGQGVFNNGSAVNYYTSSQPSSYSNPNLKWETTRQFNIGLDAAAFSGRVQLTVDWFQKYTYDLLLDTPIPITSGFGTTVLNVGNIKNHGIDIEVRTVNLQGAVKWNTSVNFSSYRNEVTKLATPTDVLLGSGLMLREGQPIGTFYGYKFDGIFQTDEEAANSPVLNGQQNTPANAATRARAGDRKYVDVNPDGVIDEKDRTILGNALPKFTWGMNNNISYKAFNLSFFIQGSYGNKMANLNSLPMEDFRGTQNVSAEAGLNRWTPSNPSNRYPRALANRTIDVGTFSSTVVEDASYARLKNVTLSYNIPASLLSRIGARSVRVYVSGTNLVTITKYTGFDPEGSSYGTATAYPGVDQGRYPLTKTYLVGLNIGL